MSMKADDYVDEVRRILDQSYGFTRSRASEVVDEWESLVRASWKARRSVHVTANQIAALDHGVSPSEMAARTAAHSIAGAARTAAGAARSVGSWGQRQFKAWKGRGR